MPGLFDPIIDMLPVRARVIKDPLSTRYGLHFARVEPGSGAAIHQGRYNSVRGQLEFTAPPYATEPAVLHLTRAECDTLYEALAKALSKTPDQALKDEIAAGKKALAEAQQERDDARGRNRVLVNEAGRHKNELREAQARLTLMTDLYNSLLDRLSK
ncbi:hypothetical protein [Streptomyces sp. CB03238]|uniref:hypothetical protein n=1 Tax=Streptomyces sp. CB03238 TaxID=1907777 RepID=UPI000A10E08C|nr:hypothetical protein [Streptomyces sp. CB03238]ORT58210.1 hypothetical protein BKD26_20115 [Streptomyces sp. CB03238]